MNQNNMDLKETYNRIAEDWDREHRGDDWWIEGTNDFIGLVGAGALVLDGGCGNGIKMKYLVDHGLSAEGMDFSEKMIELARARVPFANCFVRDLRDMEALDRMYDGIYLSASLLHLYKHEIVGALRGLAKHLKNGGYLYIAVKERREHEAEEEIKRESNLGYEYERFFSYFSVDEVVKYLTLTGLHLVSARSTTSGRRNWIQVIGRKGN